MSDTLNFEFSIPDSTDRYNVIMIVRNTIDFETTRLFVQYELSGESPLRKRLIQQNLFDRKTGEPFGDSGLGDIYVHRFLLEPGISFPKPGLYEVQLNHMMRTDTLYELRSIGIRVEQALK